MYGDRTTTRRGRISALPCGRRTKWAVLVFWLVVVAAVGGLAGKLQGAEKNDASAYLPASAESTQELNLQEKFVSKNLNPAVVVYTRASGITHADVVKATADARAFKALGPVHGQVTGPVMARDHKALETVIGADLGDKANFAAFVDKSENNRIARVARPLCACRRARRPGRGRDKDLQRH